MNAYIQTHRHPPIYKYMHMHKTGIHNAHIDIQIHRTSTYLHVCIHMYTHMQIYMNKWTNIHILTNRHTQAYRHMNKPIYIHIYPSTCIHTHMCMIQTCTHISYQHSLFLPSIPVISGVRHSHLLVGVNKDVLRLRFRNVPRPSRDLNLWDKNKNG